MEKVCTGMTARSLAGHDRGKVYLVLSGDETYIYLADGRSRTLNRPKRKKWKHVQMDRHIVPWIRNLMDQGKKLQDSDVGRALKEYGCKQEVRDV